jgi:hypothetical protein
MDSTERDTSPRDDAAAPHNTDTSASPSPQDTSPQERTTKTDTDATRDSYKNPDDSFDLDRVFRDFAAGRDTIIAHLAAFSDSMVDNDIWTADQRTLFRDSITSADTAKLFHSAIQNFNRAYPGSFSPAAPNAQDPAQNHYSNSEKRDMYHQAFERMKTNHIDGEMEIKRLDKLFGVK